MHEVGHALGLRHNFRASRIFSADGRSELPKFECDSSATAGARPKHLYDIYLYHVTAVQATGELDGLLVGELLEELVERELARVQRAARPPGRNTRKTKSSSIT